jgi:general stress protein YciG
MPSKRQPTSNGKCRAKTKAGRDCAAPAVRSGIYCAFHNDPERAAELGRRGGTRSRKVYESPNREIPAPKNACDVKNLLAEAMAEIRAPLRVFSQKLPRNAPRNVPSPLFTHLWDRVNYRA